MVAVCDQVVEADWIEFAWIGVDTPGEPPLEPQAWSGKNPTYLDAITLDGAGPSTEPAWQTASSGESTIVETVLEEVQSEGWRKQALSSGYQSVLSVPLAYDEYAYGVLTVYASETDAFGDLERRVFEELGENIASSINSAETRQALHTDTTLEVQLQFEHPGRVLDNIARTGDCTVTYQSHATETTGQSRLFFTADDAETETLDAVLDDLHAVESYSLVNEDSSSQLFVATVTGSLLVEHLVRHGGKPRSVVATPEATVATVDLPLEVDVREYVEMLTEQFGPVELDSRRTVERELQTPTGHRSTLFGTLTERQLEVLRTAYFGGFFEWPRESTGEEIAELLDVSQPTVNRHLRLGQQALLSELFSG
jgi:predicted DNA binding protein